MSLNQSLGQSLGLTSMRCELTRFPFLFQVTLGLGSPVAWQTKDTTPPETPIMSTGTLVNLGGAERSDKKKRKNNYYVIICTRT